MHTLGVFIKHLPLFPETGNDLHHGAVDAATPGERLAIHMRWARRPHTCRSMWIRRGGNRPRLKDGGTYNSRRTRDARYSRGDTEYIRTGHRRTLSASDFAHQLRLPSYVFGLLTKGEVGRIGVHGLQACGLFKIVEIVGRRRVVGYKLD
ncbi:hypothetical protein BJ912DRAFT_1144264 [Pholiota molesta]|nr:hypothetical protein BJ912DRAFT_1144264 [Pholiota molesta]